MSPLAAADLAHLERALHVALAPGDHDCPAAWGAALCAAVGALVGVDMYGTVVSLGEGAVHRLIHTDVPDDVDRAYRGGFAPHDFIRARMLARRLQVADELDVCTTAELGGSGFYNEFALAYRVPFNLVVSAPTASVSAGPTPLMILTLPEWPDEALRSRVRAALPLLVPAFGAGVRVTERLAGAPGDAARLLDVLSEPTLVCDWRGATVHRNPACEALLGELRRRGGGGAVAAVEVELRALAAGLGALLSPKRAARGGVREGNAPPPVRRELRVAGLRLEARACLGAAGGLGLDGRSDRLVWIVLERVGHDGAPALAASAALQGLAATSLPPTGPGSAAMARAGLTRQEATVATLLAARQSNEEIAAALGISPHTARTHAERVRRKLGVTRRTGVAAALSALR